MSKSNIRKTEESRFDVHDLPFETFTEFARQCSSNGSATMLYALLGCKCTPMEGGNVHGDNDAWTLGFRDERTGLGYQISYWLTVHDDDADYCDIEDVEIVRDERWDAETAGDEFDVADAKSAIDYEQAFRLLTDHLARRRAEELRRDTNSSCERAWAYELAYAFAEGVIQSQGGHLPELM